MELLTTKCNPYDSKKFHLWVHIMAYIEWYIEC